MPFAAANAAALFQICVLTKMSILLFLPLHPEHAADGPQANFNGRYTQSLSITVNLCNRMREIGGAHKHGTLQSQESSL